MQGWHPALRGTVRQAVFKRYRYVATGLVREWERTEKRPRGGSLKLLALITKNDLAAGGWRAAGPARSRCHAQMPARWNRRHLPPQRGRPQTSCPRGRPYDGRPRGLWTSSPAFPTPRSTRPRSAASPTFPALVGSGSPSTLTVVPLRRRDRYVGAGSRLCPVRRPAMGQGFSGDSGTFSAQEQP